MYCNFKSQVTTTEIEHFKTVFTHYLYFFKAVLLDDRVHSNTNTDDCDPSQIVNKAD